MTTYPRPIAFEIAKPFLEKIAVSFGRLGPEGFFRALRNASSRKDLSANLARQDEQLNNLRMAIQEGTLPRSSPIYEILPPDLQQVQNRQIVDSYLLKNIDDELKNVSDQRNLINSFEAEVKNIGPTYPEQRAYQYSLEAQRRAEDARRQARMPSSRLRAERESFPEPHYRALIPIRDYRALERDLPLAQRLMRSTGYGKTVPEIVDEPLRKSYLNKLRTADEIRGGRDLTPAEISRVTDRLPEAPFDETTGRNLLSFEEMPRTTRQLPPEFDTDRLSSLYQRELQDLQDARRRFAEYDPRDGTLVSRSVPQDSFLSNQAFRKQKDPALFFDPVQGGVVPPSNQRIVGAAESTMPPVSRRPVAEPTWPGAGFTDPVPLQSQNTATVRLEPTSTNVGAPFVPLDDMLATSPKAQPLKPIGQTGDINPKYRFSGQMSQSTDPLKTFTGIRIKGK